VEFKREAHRLFQEMLVRSEEQVMRVLLSPRLMVRVEGRPAASTSTAAPVGASSTTSTRPAAKSPSATKPQTRVGRNDPCPCGSGKKYKHCCGKKERG
jgi:preprotein translocase subunit SecA